MAIDPRNIELMDPAMLPITRGMTGAQKLRIAAGMFESARRMTAARVRHEHPDWSDTQVHQETVRRINRGAG